MQTLLWQVFRHRVFIPRLLKEPTLGSHLSKEFASTGLKLLQNVLAQIQLPILLCQWPPLPMIMKAEIQVSTPCMLPLLHLTICQCSRPPEWPAKTNLPIHSSGKLKLMNQSCLIQDVITESFTFLHTSIVLVHAFPDPTLTSTS